jgi:hypothetical protein
MTVATIPRGLLLVCLAAGAIYIASCQKTELIQVRDNRPLMGMTVAMVDVIITFSTRRPAIPRRDRLV